MKNKEQYTNLNGREIVHKGDDRIEFKGQLDTFRALLAYVRHSLKENKELFDQLGEVEKLCVDIMIADTGAKKLENIKIFGYDSNSLKEVSNYPEKHFGVEHFLPDGSYEQSAIMLNMLRTQIRTVERSACRAYKDDDSKTSIIETLNRLSGAIYVLMLKQQGGTNN